MNDFESKEVPVGKTEIDQPKEVPTYYQDENGDLQPGNVVIRFTVGQPKEEPFVFIRDKKTGKEIPVGEVIVEKPNEEEDFNIKVESEDSEPLNKYENKEDYPNGDIREVLEIDNPAESVEDIEDFEPPKEGDYYLEGGLGTQLRLGDELNTEDPNQLILVKIEKVGDIELNDIYTHNEFKKDDLVCRIGEYKTPIAIDSLRYLIKEKDNPRDSEPADIEITPEDLSKE